MFCDSIVSNPNLLMGMEEFSGPHRKKNAFHWNLTTLAKTCKEYDIQIRGAQTKKITQKCVLRLIRLELPLQALDFGMQWND